MFENARKDGGVDLPSDTHGSAKPLRADARRNFTLIVDAAERCLVRDPNASMTDIASEAGLGRVTLYGHFSSRQLLVETVMRRVLAAADEALARVDLSGEPSEALRRLIAETWRVTVRSGSMLVAAEKALPAQLVREAHGGGLEERVHDFIARGQASGAFRADLPTDWLVAAFHAILHLAANEIESNRLEPDGVETVITTTLLGIYQASCWRERNDS